MFFFQLYLCGSCAKWEEEHEHAKDMKEKENKSLVLVEFQFYTQHEPEFVDEFMISNEKILNLYSDVCFYLHIISFRILYGEKHIIIMHMGGG